MALLVCSPHRLSCSSSLLSPPFPPSSPLVSSLLTSFAPLSPPPLSTPPLHLFCPPPPPPHSFAPLPLPLTPFPPLQNPQHLCVRGNPEQPEVYGVQLPKWHSLFFVQLHAAQKDKEKLGQESQRSERSDRMPKTEERKRGLGYSS